MEYKLSIKLNHLYMISLEGYAGSMAINPKSSHLITCEGTKVDTN